ncbi:SDR family oxidoreductase [Seonamhaeicola marinus]|uniref:SDR family oxidoreductase n=1 Tax=Seonamhaeicola marinus TaxID=1912246 RepID=A0A5D0HF83_9FLAO|nr:SDR family oxidoreductase [Seonamhaeicola marinus]TYA69941.1 SDR family oxidoreductase [Seonamhaeicola marinus]
MLKGKTNPKILLAGGTGYLGGYIAKAIVQKELPAVLIARKAQKLEKYQSKNVQIIEAEVTKPKTLANLCNGVDVVISTVGITRQKDGLTYMDVDYQANVNLLEEAKKSGVRKFIYVSAINADKHRHLKMLEAKEAFVDVLKQSGIEYTILRPNGFFSDMKDFLQMAEKKRVFIFGNGDKLLNPIHGEDLAEVCLDLINEPVTEFSVGGPDVLTYNEIAEMAFDAHGRLPKITRLPDWLRRFTIWTLRKFSPLHIYGPIEFFLTLMAEDNVATRYGKHRLKDFFFEEAKLNRQSS